MSMQAHLLSLEDKHAQLESLVAAESARPLPDFTIVTSLKKQKLLIKQEIERIAAYMRRPEANAS